MCLPSPSNLAGLKFQSLFILWHMIVKLWWAFIFPPSSCYCLLFSWFFPLHTQFRVNQESEGSLYEDFVVQSSVIFFFLSVHACLVTQSCLTLCWTIACQAPVRGIFQASKLKWVAISYFRGSSWPRDQTCVSCVPCTVGGFFTCWAIREAPLFLRHPLNF